MSPHPLNQAVIAQALHDIRNGQLRRCQAMGFSTKALEALKQPALVSLLVNAKVPWFDLRVKDGVLLRLLNQVQEHQREIEAIDRMLRLGASTEMVSEFHGLTHQEVALRREVLGLASRKGRWPVLSEAQESTLWHRWHSGVQERDIDLKDDGEMLKLSMELAEEQALPLSVVWGAVRNWISKGLT